MRLAVLSLGAAAPPIRGGAKGHRAWARQMSDAWHKGRRSATRAAISLERAKRDEAGRAGAASVESFLFYFSIFSKMKSHTCAAYLTDSARNFLLTSPRHPPHRTSITLCPGCHYAPSTPPPGGPHLDSRDKAGPGGVNDDTRARTRTSSFGSASGHFPHSLLTHLNCFVYSHTFLDLPLRQARGHRQHSPLPIASTRCQPDALLLSARLAGERSAPFLIFFRPFAF